MKTYYKNNLRQAFLILEEEENQEEDFQSYMLQANEIPGILKTNVKYIDNKSHYYYDISGKLSLQSIYEKEKLDKEQIKRLVDAILQTMREVQKYMLDGTGILLDPEYIYYENGSYYFCYYPRCQQKLTEEFHRLTEFFVREVDYKDKEGVHLAYTLHKETMEEHYSIEKIMESVLAEEELTVVSYEERMEEQSMENIAIAEKKEPWKPMQRFFEKAKREKWGRWEGL